MKTNILITSTNYWHSLWFRKQRFAMMFAAEGRKVAYVNPLFTWLSFVQEAECRGIFLHGFKSPLAAAHGLSVCTQLPLFPFRRKNARINALDMALSRKMLARTVRSLWGDEEYIQIVYSPEDYLRIRPTPACRGVVYECVDEHAAYPENRRRRAYIEGLERRLLAEADLVTFTARGLWEAKASRCRRSCVIPNGVDYDKFHSVRIAQTKPPADLEKINGPVVMYIGAIMEWFDWDLVVSCARMRSDWQFVLIGPSNLPAAVLRSVPNIHYLGTKPPQQVPLYLKYAQVCLIPFILNELTRTVSPLKLYEYLSAGKPVVSVAMPEVVVDAAEGAIAIASGAKEFTDAIGKFLLTEGNEQLCLRIAERHAWPSLFARFSSELTQAQLLQAFGNEAKQRSS